MSALVCPLRLRRAADRHAGRLSHRAGLLHATTTAGCSIAWPEQAAGVINNSIGLRADQARLADRSAHGAAQHALHVRAPDARAGARRAPRRRKCRCWSWTWTGSRRSTTATGTTSATARCARWRACCATGSGRTTSASAMRATSSSSVLSGRGAADADQEAQGAAAGHRGHPFEVRPGRFQKLGARSATPCSRTTAWRHESLLATADKRMYQDKAERKARTSMRALEEMPGKRPSVFAKIPKQPASDRTH